MNPDDAIMSIFGKYYWATLQMYELSGDFRYHPKKTERITVDIRCVQERLIIIACNTKDGDGLVVTSYEREMRELSLSLKYTCTSSRILPYLQLTPWQVSNYKPLVVSSTLNAKRKRHRDYCKHGNLIKDKDKQHPKRT
jgi:hypothetical protein